MIDVGAIAAEVDARLREASDPKRREFTSGYFPSALENLGVAVPHIRKVVRDLKRRLKDENAATVLSIARSILADRTLEGRQVAYETAAAHDGMEQERNTGNSGEPVSKTGENISKINGAF